MKRKKLLLAVGLALCAAGCAQGWAQGGTTSPPPNDRTQAPKPFKRKIQHPTVAARSDREKQERAMLKAERNRQKRLAKKQRRDARRNTRRPIIQ